MLGLAAQAAGRAAVREEGGGFTFAFRAVKKEVPDGYHGSSPRHRQTGS